jgi:hypothetical protein
MAARPRRESRSDKARLKTIVSDRNQQQKHVERARVVLAAAKSFLCSV